MASIDKISKVLNQAENAGTPAEAEAFMEKAMELAARAGVDLAVARMHQKDKTKREVCEERYVHTHDYSVEWRRGIRSQWAHELYVGLAQVNDLMVTRDNEGRSVWTFGFPSDHAVTDAMYTSLLFQMVKQADDAIKRGDHKEKVWVQAGEYNGFTEPAKTSGYRMRSRVTGQVFRANYYAGFVERAIERCWEAKREAERRAGEANPDPTAGTALALREKKQDVHDQYQAQQRKKYQAWGMMDDEGNWTKETLDGWAEQDKKGSYRAPRGYDGPTVSYSRFSQNAGRAGADRATLGASTSVGAGEAARLGN